MLMQCSSSLCEVDHVIILYIILILTCVQIGQPAGYQTASTIIYLYLSVYIVERISTKYLMNIILVYGYS